MTNEECYKILKQYNKWRRGRGKKYSQPGFPFSPEDIGVAIDKAIDCVRAICKMQMTIGGKNSNEQAQ